MPNAEQFAAPVPAAVKAAAARATQLQTEFITPPKLDENGKPIVEENADTLEAGVENVIPPDEQPPAESQTQEPAENDDSWKHKFLSMQGRFNSQRAQLQTMSQEIGNLNRLLATVQRPEPAKPAEPAKQLVTPEELAEYGPELVDLMTRVAQQATAPYQQEITQLKTQIQQTNGQIQSGARENLLAKLEEEVPNWAEQNDDPEFVAWLALPDTYSGAIRHDLLKAAFARNDSRRVVNFFKGFLAETAATAPSEQEPGKPAALPGNKASLTNFAAPGRAKSTAAPSSAPGEKPIFTTPQITAFYTDRANGKYRGREDVAKKIEADIFLAQSEGRIR
jgi:hypothetical protein